MTDDIVIFGTGRMGAEHLKAIRAAGREPACVVGRDRARADAFAKEHEVRTISGGHGAYLGKGESAPIAVVAVSHEELDIVTGDLIAAGVHRILLEKPGALDTVRLSALKERADAAGADIRIAYNRRYFPSVMKLRDMAAAAGGVTSCHFDFTEIERLVLAEGVSDAVLARWGVVNATHIVDLAFHIAGAPAELTCVVDGALPWHPAGAVFAGSGRSEAGAMLSYAANWTGPGRWAVEAVTAAHKFRLCPLEVLTVQGRDGFATEDVTFDDGEEARAGVKPGFLGQMRAFLGDAPDDALCTLDDHVRLFPIYERIFGYRNSEPRG